MVRLSNIHTFENGQLKQVLVDGGYIPMDDWSGTYRFYVKDHLGNNRMVVHQSGTIEQVNNYYPYGGLMANSTGWNTQRYKYNGKEFDRMHGLDWYDYGARWMDASIGRWHSVDPLCEKYYNVSPYVYCAGNPIRYVDPDGRKIVLAENSSEDFIKQFNNAFNYLKSHNAAGVWMQLDEKTEIITIYENSKKANYKIGNEIHWNPYSGLLVFDGGNVHRLSPAIRLLHEMGHNLQELTGEYNTVEDGSAWQNPEEKRNILEVETPAARACGEIPENSFSRDSHSGIAFPTSSSSTNVVIYTNDEESKRLKMYEEQ